MYAVIATGGKQERVEVGSRVDVELLGEAEGAEVSFPAVLVVDGADVLAGPKAATTTVTGRIVGSSAGPKITGFTYQAKARRRRRFGHRQHYSTVEILSIGAEAGRD